MEGGAYRATGRGPGQPARTGLLVAVWLATIGYLIVELSFNARLLDVVGGNATAGEVDRIEAWGRLISGFALALFGWPWWIRQAWSRYHGTLRRIWHVAWWSLLAMLAMYAVQEAILRSLVNRSSEAQLLQAQHLVLLRSGLHEGMVKLPGLEVGEERLASAEGKAFLAMFPMLASGLGELIGTRFDAGQRDRVSLMLVTRKMGDPNLHLDGYRSLVQAIHEGYLRYGEALADVDRKGAEAWSQYTRDLRNGATSANRCRAVTCRVRSGCEAAVYRWPTTASIGQGMSGSATLRPAIRQPTSSAPDGRRIECLRRLWDLPDSYGEFMQGKEPKARFLAALG